jgi:nitrite reductase/ring-hydroxylating ferredoxin subunit
MLFEGDHKRIRVKIGTKADLPPCNQVREFMASGKMLCIANVNGEIYAADNQCLHWGGPLGQGRIVEGRIECPWHGWTFDPKTGEGPPKAAGRKLPTHPVTIEGDDVFVEIEAAVHARAAF